MAYPRIRDHVPHFYGHVEVSDVLGENRDSIAGRYLLDCCYSLEYVNGNELKLGFYAGQACPPHIDKLLKHMEAAGIDYLLDASVFMPDHSKSFKIIDFATREIEVPLCEM